MFAAAFKDCLLVTVVFCADGKAAEINSQCNLCSLLGKECSFKCDGTWRKSRSFDRQLQLTDPSRPPL